ncbi:HAMP domain-containing sensor histidine kinase [Cellulomonas cellasea]|uniref:histidine kinase n=1 Tax=Cellulomonas cellasea TaxID=43670 RepID=A0A7W4UIE8_9CELL|nr:HAMP domain-containing sensor histidine kinase [Cellulomonas cellasea]MBB2924756.1 two-component system OmpR family sensor kinase [Cellulomonas cellasea]
MTGSPRRWTLGRRLVAVLVALLALVAGVMGVASTLALRGTLLDQVDARLESASARAATAPGARPGDAPGRTPGGDDATGSADPSAGDATDGAGADADEGTGAGSTPDGRRIPFALRGPGQDVGTLSLDTVDGHVAAGYVDDAGTFRRLTDAQTAALAATTADSVPRTVDVDGLGSYRVVATSGARGLVVTGLPTGPVAATVTRYVVVEVAVAVAGLGVAAAVGTVLVRRELRPLHRVAATATRVAGLPLDRGEVVLADRVPAQDTDPATEVGQVGAALNRLLGHVESALAARQESETQVRHFVADASHELRTPLASIRGYAELVRRSPDALPDDAVRAMQRVESEALRMTALVEDLLLLARLDAGRELEHAEVDLTALALDAVADAHVAAPGHVWHLDVDDDPAHPPLVRGDDHRLRQVLVNLLANARVHTPPGTTVEVRVRADAQHVTVRVQDDGPGIAPELLPRLFQRFARGDASRNRAGGSSTGLGLAIVHAVVGAHGGTIAAESRPGRTAFTVRLPAAG